MKKNILNFCIIFSFLIILVEVFVHKILVSNTIAYSLHLWVTSLIPTMFPFFVISDILIQYHVTHYIPQFIKNAFCRLFGVSENAVSIFFLSCIGGFPSNARNTRKYYDLKLISKEEAEHILTFTHFSNPLFVLSTVAVFFFHQEKYGWIILFSHFMGNILIGLFFRKYNTPSSNYTLTNEKSQNFSFLFIRAIKNAIDTLLLILGTLTSFLIVSSLIIQALHLSAYPGIILKGILEMTMGIKELSLLPIPAIYKVVITTMFLSFGGLSVHLQVLSQIADTDISYLPFFFARIIHALLSGLIVYFFYLLLF